jgi:hypothetical protein
MEDNDDLMILLVPASHFCGTRWASCKPIYGNGLPASARGYDIAIKVRSVSRHSHFLPSINILGWCP